MSNPAPPAQGPSGQPNPMPNAPHKRLQEERFSPFWRVTVRRWTKWYLEGTETFWPFTDLIIRFFVALWFLRSGLVKAADWETALYLATNEYPVSFMSPANAAAIGLGIELVGPVLLLLGFFTRPAALAMAALTLISHAVYVPTTPNPTSGYLEIVPLERVTSTDWTLDEAMAFIMSGGAVAPDTMNYDHPPDPGGE